jgi:hypothetical protein
MAIRKPLVTGTGSELLEELQAGDTISTAYMSDSIDKRFVTDAEKAAISSGSGTLLENGFVLRLSTFGNGTATYILTAASTKVLVFIDGVLQSDYTQPNGTTTLVLGFTPRNDELVEVYEFNTAASATTTGIEPLSSFLLMGA